MEIMARVRSVKRVEKRGLLTGGMIDTHCAAQLHASQERWQCLIVFVLALVSGALTNQHSTLILMKPIVY